jgi:hypothetical protein
MIPDCWTPACLLEQAAGQAADSAAEAALAGVTAPIEAALAVIFTLLVSWLLIPAVDLLGDCAAQPGSGGPGCAASPSLQLRQWMIPVTALVLLAGLTWQGVVTAVTRKGQPLLQAGKGLITAAAWGAVGIAGTQLALRAGDQYACWIIGQSLEAGAGACDPRGIGTGLLADQAVANLTRMLQMTGTPLLSALFGLIVLLIVLVQLLLLVFREVSIVILAGLLQLAAAGVVTRGTAGWFQKMLSWMLTLLAYKPIVATVYAVNFLMLAGPQPAAGPPGPAGTGQADAAGQLRWLIFGLAMLVLSLVALPAAAKFFSWTAGQTATGGGGGGMLAGAAMAGMYALGSHQPGPASAADQARATEHALPPPSSPPAPAPPAGATSPAATGTGTAGPGAETPADGAGTGTGTTAAGVAPAAAAGGTAGGAAATGAGTAAGGTAAASGAAAGGTGVASGAAAAGPVGLAAVAVVHGTQQAHAAAQRLAEAGTEDTR